MTLFAQSGVVTGLMLGSLGLVIGWLLLRTHRYLSRQKRNDSPLVRVGRPEQTNSVHHLDAPPEVARWEVQMHETARELSATLDSKMRALQALIAEADRAAARLEAAGAESPHATRQPDPPDHQPATQAEALRPSGGSGPGADADAESTRRPSARRCQEEIYTLADYGVDALEIARRVGSPVGEVELILGLREKK